MSPQPGDGNVYNLYIFSLFLFYFMLCYVMCLFMASHYLLRSNLIASSRYDIIVMMSIDYDDHFCCGLDVDCFIDYSSLSLSPSLNKNYFDSLRQFHFSVFSLLQLNCNVKYSFVLIVKHSYKLNRCGIIEYEALP